MERRKEPRFSRGQSATLTTLGAGRSELMDVGVVDMSDGGLRVRASAPVPCGTPVKIDGNHTLMLGEVCRCVPEEGAYTVGIQLTCTLSSFAELEQLDRALVGEQRVWEVESPSRIA